MEQSHLVRSLRFTFLTVGFLAFVLMTAQWVQHLATVKPAITPRFIASMPSADNLTGEQLNNDMRVSSVASFVQASSNKQPANGNNQPTVSSDAAASSAKAPTGQASDSTATHPHAANELTTQVKSVVKSSSSKIHKPELHDAAL